MALLTWRERNSKGTEVGPVWYLDFDATLLEEFTRSAEVTRFPVESGAVLSDHYQAQPRAITLEAQVTDTPVSALLPVDGKQPAARQPVGSVGPKALDLPVNRAKVTGITGTRFYSANASRVQTQRTASVLQFTDDVHRTIDVFQVLDGLMTAGQLVDVLLFRDLEYKNMVITNIRTPRDAQSGSTLAFTIDLQQIQFADTTTEQAPEPAAAKHSPKRDGGKRNGTDTENDPIAYAQAQAATRY